MASESKRSTIRDRILAILSDGMPHCRYELLACLEDSEAELRTLQVHISMMRKPIRLRGEDIVCELFDGSPHYRHIKLLVWPTPTKPEATESEQKSK